MKTYAEVASLVNKSKRVSEVHLTDAAKTAGGLIHADGLSKESKNLLSFYKPILEQIDWNGDQGHDPKFSKRAETTKKLMACHAMNRILARGVENLKMEAQIYSEMSTTAVDLPQFVRQLLLTINRVYARLFTPELFGVLPLNQPYGRLHFRDFEYDTAFTGSTPTINAGDRTDDITKYNPDFYKAAEGQQANRTKIHYSFITVNTFDSRIITLITDEMQDDAMSVYGDNVEAQMIDHNSREMARQIDRGMVTALVNNVPSYNNTTWTSQPVSNPDYASLDPLNQAQYDQGIYRDGILSVISKIRTTRKLAADGDPDWCICGTNFAYKLSRLASLFVAAPTATEFKGARGALRDYGVLKGEDIRFLVDVMLGTTYTNAGSGVDGTNAAIFGRLPVERNDVGLYFMPYIALQPTRNLYDPETGVNTIGMRSRWGIAQPNTGQSAASSQLADIYGQLAVS